MSDRTRIEGLKKIYHQMMDDRFYGCEKVGESKKDGHKIEYYRPDDPNELIPPANYENGTVKMVDFDAVENYFFQRELAEMKEKEKDNSISNIYSLLEGNMGKVFLLLVSGLVSMSIFNIRFPPRYLVDIFQYLIFGTTGSLMGAWIITSTIIDKRTDESARKRWRDDNERL